MLRWLAPQAIQRRFVSGDPSVRRTLRPLLFGGLKYRARLPPQHLFTDDELRAIAVTTRVILGERSVIHPARAVAARLESLNPHIRTEIVPRATHALSLEQAELVTTRVLDLARHP